MIGTLRVTTTICASVASLWLENYFGLSHVSVNSMPYDIGNDLIAFMEKAAGQR